MYNLESLKSENPSFFKVLFGFKTTPCTTLQQNSDHFGGSPTSRSCFCAGYHSAHEMRRPVFDEQSNSLSYDPFPCPSLQEGLPCPEGSRCRFCHTQNELDYHPLNYKTDACTTNCAHPHNILFCPRYHPEEPNRKTLVEKLLFNRSEMPNQEQFNLDTFKVRPCMKKNNHNLKICDFYHHEKDRRRAAKKVSYTPPLCQYVIKNVPCPNGENCGYAHNKLEQLYHPERYKRKFCLHYPHNIHKCEYGDYCSFVHHESEIEIDLLHNMKQDESFYLYKYKTVFCPYIYEHDRNQCAYAHNSQDIRRDPRKYNYNAVRCPSWSQSQIFSYEEGGCPKQMNCENCHGWKELEYHPMHYKTQPCPHGKKCNKKDCSFYHTDAEKRQVKVSSSLSSLTSSLTRSLLSAKPPLKQEQQQQQDPINEMNFGFAKMNLNNNSNSNQDFDSWISSMAPSTNFTENDIPVSGGSGKQRSQEFEWQALKASSTETFYEKPKPESMMMKGNSTRGGGWDFGESYHHKNEDKFKDFIKTNHKSSFPGYRAFDYPGWENQEKVQQSFEKPVERKKDQLKLTFMENLRKKGLGRTVQFLNHPKLDMKTLQLMTREDFKSFPFSEEEKDQIIKIIQDLFEEEVLFSEVNSFHDFETRSTSRYAAVEDDLLWQ